MSEFRRVSSRRNALVVSVPIIDLAFSQPSPRDWLRSNDTGACLAQSPVCSQTSTSIPPVSSHGSPRSSIGARLDKSTNVVRQQQRGTSISRQRRTTHNGRSRSDTGRTLDVVGVRAEDKVASSRSVSHHPLARLLVFQRPSRPRDRSGAQQNGSAGRDGRFEYNVESRSIGRLEEDSLNSRDRDWQCLWNEHGKV